MNRFDAVIIFAIIGFVAQSFSKNMIFILIIQLIIAALYVTLFNNIKEGLKDKSDHKDDEKKTKKPHCHKHLTEKDCAEPCKWNKETNKCHSTHHKKNKEQLAQLHPQWIKDDEKTEEEFYKSVDDNVPDLGIQDMADKTSQLIEKQKKLRTSMDKILPLVDQTNKFMDSINFDKLTGVLSGLNSNN